MIRGDLAPSLLDQLVQRPAWMRAGACRLTPEVSFVCGPYDDPGPALAVCRSCPVREPCLAYALEHHEVGVWGGTTGRERRRLRAARVA